MHPKDNAPPVPPYSPGGKEFPRSGSVSGSVISPRIVEYACLNGFFEEYIQRYEYEQRCFERGNELFERERSVGHNDEQERL